MEKYLLDCNNLKIEEFEFSSGSFSKVYKGYYLDRPVCVKVIKKDNIEPPDLLVFIDREIDILKDLLDIKQKNIVEFIGVGERDKLLFLVTELVNGGDLGEVLRNENITLPWNLKFHIAKGIAQGMKFLHSKNIMHRDLKSNNLLVGKEWDIKICDFGFAKVVNPQSLTTTICGTDEFMSPEVILGMPYSYSSDIYSFGMVVIELITQTQLEQRLPQNNFDVDVDALASVVPPDCPDRFWRLGLKSASYYPKDRPSFDEILFELDEIAKEVEDQFNSPFPPSPHVIQDPNFDDENHLDHWCMLSNLPDDCLEKSKKPVFGAKEKLSSISGADLSPTQHSPEQPPQQPGNTRWYCSIM